MLIQVSKKLLIALCFMPITVLAQQDILKSQYDLLGTIVDELKFTDYIKNEPINKNFDHTFKVLEFWASWCKPCLKAVPHLNKLQNRFADQNIVFLSVTNQSPEEILPVFEKVKFETIVVSDQTKTLHKSLRIESNGYMVLPRTVLIDDENKIVWFGLPSELTTTVIERFLKKEKIKN